MIRKAKLESIEKTMLESIEKAKLESIKGMHGGMTMSIFVLGFQGIDQTKIAAVGGKGANLGELARMKGIRVPDGFCITTEAFKRVMEQIPTARELLGKISHLNAEDRIQIEVLGGEIQKRIRESSIPEELREEIKKHLSEHGEEWSYAVRSSATAEDLPAASFAGQHDTYLNVVGAESVLERVRSCWASLFTERAIIYRIQNGIDHQNVLISVVVQKMVFPEASGILFTADPVTSHRKILSIDAGFGLGEAMVSGLVNPDVYRVRNGGIIDKKINTKKLAIYALKNGGTETQELRPEQQNDQVLTDEQILQLERIGRRIEEQFGSPQDIEWCLEQGEFYIVQSRPITTLYPIPETSDRAFHVFVSVGHQQMMTDPMKPLGISLFERSSFGPRFKAGGRLFVDVAPLLAQPESRENLLNMMGQHEPLIKDALATLIRRNAASDAIPQAKETETAAQAKETETAVQAKAELNPTLPELDPDIVANLIRDNQSSIEEMKHKIWTKSGTDLIDLILEDLVELKRLLFHPDSTKVFMAAMDASIWINEKMNAWLGEKNAADVLSRSVPNNITSEMGLALLEVADAIRPHPEVINYLQNRQGEDFLDGLDRLHGGRKARDAICAFLDQYGMRCPGEIDITKTRWSENPSLLIPMILGNVKSFEPNAGRQRFEQGRLEALEKEEELLRKLRTLPDGEQKSEETKRRIDLIRNFSGYREYPKYGMICRYFVYKQTLLKEAERLVKEGILLKKEDLYYLTLEELRDVVQTGQPDHRMISKRKEEFQSFIKFTPPRVITSDGEIVTGAYHREGIPHGAMAGLPVSSGVIEGRARVLLHMEDAELEKGDILVTSFTDPSWTPLFVSATGLVTEVGGLHTHGAVIAREYGLPAVVGIEHATERIKDGQRIRVNGTEGYVELL